MVRVDKCDMTNGIAPFARQTFCSRKKRKKLPPDTVPYLFPVTLPTTAPSGWPDHL